MPENSNFISIYWSVEHASWKNRITENAGEIEQWAFKEIPKHKHILNN